MVELRRVVHRGLAVVGTATLLAGLTLGQAGIAGAAPADPAGSRGNQGGQGTVTVLIKAPASTLAELKARYGAGFDFGADGFITDVPAAALAGLQQRPSVLVEVQPVRSVLGRFEQLSGRTNKPGNDSTAPRAVPSDQTPWGIEVTYNSATTTNTSGGGGIRVAILDTGVASHPDLKPPVVCVDASKGNVARFGTCKDGHGHGTHVTGTILAHAGSDGMGIYGVAPDASYSAYKVCSDGGLCGAGAIAWSIRHAADNGANIISMSLGGSGMSTAERDAINHAVSKGVLIIAAAGNSGPELNTINYPAAYEKVVAVAALQTVDGTETGTQTRTITTSNLKVADFSSRGINDGDGIVEEREIEVAAPGYRVESTFKDGGYAIWSGTSMATPHMSGLAAKMWQSNAETTRQWLQTKAAGYDITQGFHATGGDDPASGRGNPRVS